MFSAYDLQLLMLWALKKRKKKNHNMFLREKFYVNFVYMLSSHKIHVRHNWLCTLWHITCRIHNVVIRTWSNGVLCCSPRNFSMDRYVFIYLPHREQNHLKDKTNSVTESRKQTLDSEKKLKVQRCLFNTRNHM